MRDLTATVIVVVCSVAGRKRDGKVRTRLFDESRTARTRGVAVRQRSRFHYPAAVRRLGPAAAASSIVLGVLNGLKDMNASSPWITLFNRQSQHASGAKFQVTYVDSDATGQPQLTLVCFAVNAQKTLTQVLFFKFTSQTLQLKQSTGKLGVTLDRLNVDRTAIAGRLDSFIASNIQNIDI